METARELSNHRQDEKVLEQERNLLQTVMDNIPDFVVVKDAQSRFITVNAALLHALGLTSVQQIVGKTDHDFSPPEMAAHYQEDDRKVRESGEPLLHREELHLDAQGNERWLLTSKIPIRDGTANVTGTVSIHRNITELKRAQEEIAKARDKALEASRMKSEFLANMSHEIRTPMNGVLGMAGLLLDTELTSEQRDYGETIRNSAEALLTVINDILDFSKIEAGKMTIEPGSFDMRLVMEETADLLAVRAEQKGIELVCRCVPDIPASLLGDAGRIRQVLMNLAGNAIKFTERGHVIAEVQCLKQTEQSVTLQIQVRDTGIGIPAEKLHFIFEKFTQADASTSRRFGGTGLGLAISKQLVELMGGELQASSVVGEGSTFTVVLPLPMGAPLPAAEPVFAGFSGVRALAVDDNPVNRQLLHEMLTQFGMIVHLEDSAQKGIARLREARESGRPFQVALVDYQMPEMDGEDMAVAVKEDPVLADTTPLILLSSVDRSVMRSPGEAGFAAILSKPVRRRSLLEAIAGVLRPSGQASLGVRRAPAALSTASCVGESGKPLRVLLAEDNVVNQKVAVRMLEKVGCRVDVAANGKEAVAMVDTFHYDVVFMDCQMPEVDGFEATAQIRLRPGQAQHVPIIAMTANAMQGDRERCLECGMSDYLSKPIRLNDLVAALRKWTQRARAPALS